MDDFRKFTDILSMADTVCRYYQRLRGFMVGCDGNRLHYLHEEDVKYMLDGFYKVVKNTKTQIELLLNVDVADSTYPDITPMIEKKDEAPEDTIRSEYCDVNESSRDVALINRKMGSACINYNFVNDVLKNGNSFQIWQEGEANPVNFKNGNKFACVMPIRL